MTSFFHVASMTFDKRRNKIEMKRNMEIRDYRMRPADLGAKRVHAVSREGPRRKREGEKKRINNDNIYFYIYVYERV